MFEERCLAEARCLGREPNKKSVERTLRKAS
jgi:hypothetical protein